MSFSKALQKQQEIPGQQEWTAAYELYCKQCSVNKQILKKLKLRTDDAAVLLLYRQKEEFRRQCQEFSKASNKWAAQQIQYKLRAKGVNEPTLSNLKLAEILDMSLANNGKGLAALEQEQKSMRNMNNEELEKRSKAAEDYLEYLKQRGYTEPVKEETKDMFPDSNWISVSDDDEENA